MIFVSAKRSGSDAVPALLSIFPREAGCVDLSASDLKWL